MRYIGTLMVGVIVQRNNTGKMLFEKSQQHRIDAGEHRVICEIEELLLEMDIKPGVRLGSKEELCRCFRVSLGTLNEALRVLETRGIIELRRGSKGGVFAAAVSVRPFLDQLPFGAKRDAVAVEQCLVVLTQLEPLVAIEAAKSAQREAIAELYYLVEQMAPVDPGRWLKWRCFFQLRLAQMGSPQNWTTFCQSLRTSCSPR